ncbi:hypothetical protein VPHD530_0023 [Vibrio phage D530]
MNKLLSFNEWLEKWLDELAELGEESDLDALYKQYVASWEDAALDAALVSQCETY